MLLSKEGNFTRKQSDLFKIYCSILKIFFKNEKETSMCLDTIRKLDNKEISRLFIEFVYY